MYPRGVLVKQRIFAHRGIWGPGCEGNSLQALDQAIRLGFSIETDIRDHLGSVVVSHDPVHANSDRMCLDSLIALTKKSSSYFALNVKAYGISTSLLEFMAIRATRVQTASACCDE